MNDKLESNLILEAAEVLEAIRDSGVALPENWRWPLIDELRGIELTLKYREPTLEDVIELRNCNLWGAPKWLDALKQLGFYRKVQP